MLLTRKCTESICRIARTVVYNKSFLKITFLMFLISAFSQVAACFKVVAFVPVTDWRMSYQMASFVQVSPLFNSLQNGERRRAPFSLSFTLSTLPVAAAVLTPLQPIIRMHFSAKSPTRIRRQCSFSAGAAACTPMDESPGVVVESERKKAKASPPPPPFIADFDILLLPCRSDPFQYHFR